MFSTALALNAFCFRPMGRLGTWQHKRGRVAEGIVRGGGDEEDCRSVSTWGGGYFSLYF